MPAARSARGARREIESGSTKEARAAAQGGEGTQGPEWFAPKRYGFGTGVPIAWQGWAILVGFMALVVGVGKLFSNRPLVMAAILIPALALLVLITARTTRGSWRWRWRKRDD